MLQLIRSNFAIKSECIIIDYAANKILVCLSSIVQFAHFNLGVSSTIERFNMNRTLRNKIGDMLKTKK